MIQREMILIVDNEAGIRRLLRQSLSSAGYDCLEAGGAVEALELFRNNAVDLALLDINMPGRSGIELLGDVTISYPDTATIMLTAVCDNDICIDCMHRGAYDYITKPFNPRELTIRVKQALEKRRLRLDNRQYQLHLEEKVEEQAVRIRSDFFNALASLALALEAKDKYTAGHSQRVADISTAIASQMGKMGDEITRIRMAAMVHDIGKIGIDRTILNKPARLTDDEYKQICSHCETGEQILKPITQDEEILSMVRHHHERYDGKGYPDGIRGDSQEPDGLSFNWSIIALADAYDAMTSDRSYRKALSIKHALREIRDHAGSQFDPLVVDAFLKISQPAEKNSNM